VATRYEDKADLSKFSEIYLMTKQKKNGTILGQRVNDQKVKSTRET
jgi:hypothetical protein